MEILLGAIISLAGQGFKGLVSKWGYETSKSAAIVIVFVFSLIGTLIYLAFTKTEISLANWQDLLKVWSLSTLWYSLVIKRLDFLKVK